jgi:hypothetical protein
MVSDKRILIDGFGWPPDALLERLRSPELPGEEFWRCMSYALYVMKDDEDYVTALNEVKKERTMSAFPQQEATTPQNELYDAPPRMLPSINRAPKVFHDNLNDKSIATALLRTDRLGLGPKQFALAVRDFFLGIGWLVNTIDTQFVAWMKVHELMQAAANDLQHVSRNDTMNTLKDNLKNTFQFLNANDVWEDRRDYYRRTDSQKINDGRKRQ